MNDCYSVDVFARQPLRGNPVMVVLATANLQTAQMQDFAAWNGMPETAYLWPHAGAGQYRARIFSPRAELPFAGHPSLGAAHVALESGLVDAPAFAFFDGGFADAPCDTAALLQHCAVGPVHLRLLRPAQGDQQVFVLTPAPAAVQALDAAGTLAVADALGIAPPPVAYQVRAGAHWLVLPLAATALDGLRPDMRAIEALSVRLDVSGITVYAPVADGEAGLRFELRSFGPRIGVPEDAVCGGGNACVAALQAQLDGLADAAQPPYAGYLARQGRWLGRDGRVRILGPVADRRFWIGGSTRTVSVGRVSL